MIRRRKLIFQKQNSIRIRCQQFLYLTDQSKVSQKERVALLCSPCAIGWK